jgi:NADH-quinone oxidoreductase subunit M
VTDWPLLSIMTFLPTAGALLIIASRWSAAGSSAGYDAGVKVLTLIVTLLTFGLNLFMLAGFDSSGGFQFVERIAWGAPLGLGLAEYHMGLDPMAMALVLLTNFLMPLCILASWSIDKQVSAYMVLFLLLQTLMQGVFAAMDIVLFYVFFEGGLIPMFILIGVWGGKNRIYAAFKFFLYTLLGSVLMLVALIAMVLLAGSSSIPDITAFAQAGGFSSQLQLWLWLAFFASFAVKMPMWPVHTWLPDAHVEAPTGGSVILAGVLLKMGGYGFLRFSLPMFPDASVFFAPLVFALSVVAIVYASLVAFRQTDMKKLIAYSSVAHMGFVTMGIFAGTELGVQGAIFQMLSHGVIAGALFMVVGVIYDRMHTREIAFYGGLVHRMPVYAAIFLLFTMGNVGLPGTSGFVGEIMTMTGTFLVSPWIAAGAAIGVILSAVYALTLYRKVTFGTLDNPKLADIKDLDAREWAMFAPLVIATLVLGIVPMIALDFTRASAQAILSGYDIFAALR